MLHGFKADHMQLFKQLLVSFILHGLKTLSQKMPALYETSSIPWQCFLT